jgi:membrane protease YdiL (CAAX protease family)
MSSATFSPIKAYFAQALKGKAETQWWTWLIGFWFAIMFWMFAQMVLGIPMFGGMMFADPEAFQDFMDKMVAEESAGNSAMSGLIGLATFGLPIIAVILYLIRNSMGGATRKIMMGIAALCALLSGAALIHGMVNTPAGANEMLSVFMGKSKIVYASMLLTFPPLVFGLWLVLKFVHKRGFKTLMTAHTKFRWGRLLFSMLVFWAVAGSLTIIAHMMGFNEVPGVFDPSRFWGYALISLLLIPLQSATEEIMLRGYLNQGLAKYIKNPWIVFTLTSALFMSLHLGNPEAAEGAANGNLVITMSSYFIFGMFACLLTYIDGGLESAIGVHAANNLYASIMLGYDNSALPTPTVFKTTLNASTDVIFTVLTLGLVCAILWKFKAPLIIDDSAGDPTQVFS